MANFEEDLEYLKLKGISPSEVSLRTGLNKGSLYKVFDGTTSNPNRKTKEAISEFAKQIREENGESFGIDSNLGILNQDDPFFIKKLAMVVVDKKQELLEEPIFKDLVYIEAIKIVLQAQEGESVNINKLLKLSEK